MTLTINRRNLFDKELFESKEFEEFNAFTEKLDSTIVFTYAAAIQRGVESSAYPAAWAAALVGARKGLDDWEEEGVHSPFYQEFMDDAICNSIYEFIHNHKGKADQ